MDTPLPRLTTWLLMAILFLEPLTSGARGFSVEGGQGLILAADGLLCAVLLGNIFRIRDRRLQIAFVLVVISVVYTMFIPKFPVSGLVGGIRKSFLILVALSVGAMVGQNNRKMVHLAIIASGVVVAAYAIKQHFFFDSFDSALLGTQTSDKYTNLYKGERRSFSLLSSGFHVGIVCLIMIGYSLFTKILGRFSSAILFALAITALIFTYTRTCLIIGAVMVAYKVCRSLRIPVIVALVTLTVIYGSLALVAPDLIPNPFTEVSSDTRFTGRSVSYVGAAQAWDDSPTQLLTGFGVGSAGSAQGELFDSFDGLIHIEPHNIFLKYVFEMGFAFGIPFLLLLGSMLGSSFIAAREVREQDFVTMLIFTIVVSGLSITVVEAWPANVYLFLILGMYLRRDAIIIIPAEENFRTELGIVDKA